ncbi:MAG: NAD(P)H-binding protein [Halioglobus sp.]|nr:NAD(P)H-binding protein [Halioglobus sp.]
MSRRCSLLLLALLLAACSPSGSENPAGTPAPQLAAQSDRVLNLLVIGGSRGVGLATVQLALARGHTVTMMSRNPDKAGLEHESLTLRAASILDAVATADAIRGHAAVVISIGMGPTREPVTLFSEGAANVLAGMDPAGVTRLVTVTGIGAGETRGHGGFFYDNILQPLALATIYEDKDRQEALIRNHGGALQWTIVRPGFLGDDPANGRYRVIDTIAGVTAGPITRADTAHFILAALEQGSYIGATPLISEQ